jgi:phage-related protein (TIGR01555 family)
MAWITDSLTSAIALASRLNPFGRGDAATALPGVFSHQLALAAYMSSGMMRKVIAIPAADRTQKWRDWQAPKDVISAIEAEEKRLGLRAKTKQAEVLRGIGGGAMVLITAGEHDKPLTPDQVRKGGLIAINVVSRWEIQASDFDKDLASPTYRQPRMFKVEGEGSGQNIHPSRVICFRGDPIPAGAAVSDEDAFWGDCRLLRVFKSVQNSDHAQAWFVELIKKAKLLRIGIPDLLDLVSTDAGRQKLNERIALIATGENSLNATVYRSGTGADDPGEKIDDYQIKWDGIPAFMDALDQRVAAEADIPFTRLMGRSPAGMNATGQHDTNNWWDAVGDGQENETRPCLEAIDPFLLRSADVTNPQDVWWVWAPLEKPTEKEVAETFKIVMEALVQLISSGLVPDQALARAVQNLIEERGYLPGLADALALLSEDERFGLNPDDDGTDPSATQAEGGDPNLADPSGEDGSQTARRRAANDKATEE